MDKEYRNKSENSNKLSILMFLLLFLAVVIFAAFVYFRSQNVDIKSFSLNKFVKDKFQVSNQLNSQVLSQFRNDNREHTDFSICKDTILRISRDNIIWYDKNGAEKKYKAISTENPVVKSAGEYILIADIGGKEFYLINGMDIKWNKKSDTTIINADIDSKGFISIVNEKKGYKGGLDVFNRNGENVFTTVRSENYIISSPVYSSINRVLLNKVDTSGISADSYLELINMQAKQLYKSAGEENTIYSNLWNLGDRYIIGINDNSVTCYNMKLEKKWRRDFSQVFSTNKALGKYVIIATRKDDNDSINKGKSEIKVINSRGIDVASYVLDLNVINIACSGNIIAVNSGSEVNFINTNGKLIGKYKAKTEILKVVFFNRQEAMLQTQKSIIILKV